MISFDTIDTLHKAQILRRIRNECAEWMTGDTNWISPGHQEKFYRERILAGQVEGFLARDDGKPVGYGLLVQRDERVWASHGVKASNRGLGFGRAVSAEIVRRAHARGASLWAEVRRDNIGSQKNTYAAGYKLLDTYERDGVTIDLFCCEAP